MGARRACKDSLYTTRKQVIIADEQQQLESKKDAHLTKLLMASSGILHHCFSCQSIRILGADEERKLDVRGLFYGIGHQPNSHLVEGQIDLDDKGYVKVQEVSPTRMTLDHFQQLSGRCALEQQ